MKASKTMQQIITKIAQKHDLDLAAPSTYLRLEMGVYQPLVIEKTDSFKLSVAHYFEQTGILIGDPQIVFFTGYAEWVPIAVAQVLPGYRIYAHLTPDGQKIANVDSVPQTDLAGFGNVWARNIKNQGWLDRAHLGTKVTPNTAHRFPLGRLLTTPGAIEALEVTEESSMALFARHQSGDWGDLAEEDRQENEFSVRNGLRILSAYYLSDNTKIWIITEADRSATTILLPSEY